MGVTSAGEGRYVWRQHDRLVTTSRPISQHETRRGRTPNVTKTSNSELSLETASTFATPSTLLPTPPSLRIPSGTSLSLLHALLLPTHMATASKIAPWPSLFGAKLPISIRTWASGFLSLTGTPSPNAFLIVTSHVRLLWQQLM